MLYMIRSFQRIYLQYTLSTLYKLKSTLKPIHIKFPQVFYCIKLILILKKSTPNSFRINSKFISPLPIPSNPNPQNNQKLFYLFKCKKHTRNINFFLYIYEYSNKKLSNSQKKSFLKFSTTFIISITPYILLLFTFFCRAYFTHSSVIFIWHSTC